MTTLSPATSSDPDMAAIIRKYNEVTERLMRSQEALSGEVYRLRNALEEKNKELERAERLAALGEMAAGIAHEIRNPLGGIRLYASVLQRDLADRPRERELVRRLDAGACNLEQIVGDVLAFAGGAEPDPCNVTVGAILDASISQTAPRTQLRRVAIEIDPALHAVSVRCDARQMARALSNLIFNALDAVEAGGTIRIREGAFGAPDRETDASLCFIRIEDDGQGLEPATLQRIFDPFFTTQDCGTGLGLAIVHRIAESNGGFVTAGNRPEGGAVFVLSVPRAAGVDGPERTGGIE